MVMQPKKKPVLVSDVLRKAIIQGDETRYSIAKRTGISESTLSRFVVEGKSLGGANIDVLCEALGLELRPSQKQREQ